MQQQTSTIDADLITMEIKSLGYRNKARSILSRSNSHSIAVLSQLEPGKPIDSCLVCCSAPSCCPLFSVCICCGDADYIKQLKRSSTYVYIRENSLEWNQPEAVVRPGLCCGIDPCMYDVKDHVNVLYYDDIMFERITDKTRTCNECRTCMCGGKGERIRMDAPVCCGCCQRGSFPCLCVPFCCPKSVCPCLLRHEIYVEDAQHALYEIKKARSTSISNRSTVLSSKKNHSPHKYPKSNEHHAG